MKNFREVEFDLKMGDNTYIGVVRFYVNKFDRVVSGEIQIETEPRAMMPDELKMWVGAFGLDRIMLKAGFAYEHTDDLAFSKSQREYQMMDDDGGSAA